MKKLTFALGLMLVPSLFANFYASGDPTRPMNNGMQPWEQQSYGMGTDFCPQPQIQQPQIPLNQMNMQRNIPGMINPAVHGGIPIQQ